MRRWNVRNWKGDIPAMIIAAFITFIPVAILVLGIILVAGYFLLH